MKRFSCLLSMFVLVGCSQSTVDTAVTAPVTPDPTVNQTAESEGNGATGSVIESVPTDGVTTTLTPENTRIEFVGTHADKDPDPNARHGHFADFLGNAIVADDELKSLSVEIKTESVTTGIDKLNAHLKNADFFDVRSYPTATFKSTRIARNDDGDYIIDGQLTLLETTKEVSFPARVGMSDNKLTLKSSFNIDRREFGMTGVPNVKDIVSMTIAIGEGASTINEQAGRRGARGEGGGEGRGGGPGGRPDPAARFKEMDADKDGKLTGDEIPQRMRDNLANIDTDNDQSVSLEEMQAMFARFRQGGGRGGRRGGDGNDGERPDRPNRPEE